MELTNYVYALSGALATGIAIFFIQYFFPSYAREKGKNLATKEDIELITKKIESVRVDYSKQLESHKSKIWQDQQQYLWAKEEIKLKIETFKKSIVDVAKLINLVKRYQLFLSERELALAAAGISKAASDEGSYAIYSDKSRQFADLSVQAFSEFRDVLVEMGGLYALFSVYFTSELSESLTRILNLANRAIEQKMTFESISELLHHEYHACGSLESARIKVGLHYDQLCDSLTLGLESQLFFDLLKGHVNSIARS
jgi:hypothetical protein